MDALCNAAYLEQEEQDRRNEEEDRFIDESQELVNNLQQGNLRIFLSSQARMGFFIGDPYQSYEQFLHQHSPQQQQQHQPQQQQQQQ